MSMHLQHPASANSQGTVRYICGSSSLGDVLLAWGEKGICAVLLGDSLTPLPADLAQRFPQANLQNDGSLAMELEQVVCHLDNPRLPFDLPLAPCGSTFQQRVWRVLQQIPPGRTLTYSAIAHLLGQPKAYRAVANACAANAVAVIIPCHRAVRQDGGLSGYRWGGERKRTLLERESYS